MLRIVINIGLYGYPRTYWYSQVGRFLRAENLLGEIIPSTEVNSLDEFLNFVGVDISTHVARQEWNNTSGQIRTLAVDRNENDFMVDRNNNVCSHGRVVF